MAENIIQVQNITKIFKINTKKGIFRTNRVPQFENKNQITALDNVSFNVSKGEVLGIIGLNGSGKTTLMQTIAGLYEPDEGHVTVNGTLSPILRIGTGFQADLLPHENIIMFGMLLGFSKQSIKKEIPNIMKFADLEQFSNMKLRHFSSGMKSRLAVSTIFKMNPEILLLDESLAVGDLNFKQKCFKTFLSFKEKGVTILHATHSLNTLPEVCDRVLLLHKGKVISIGNPHEIIKKYKEIINH